MASAGRRRLASLLRAALVAKQDTSFSLHQGHCITSPATQQSLFASWLESNLNSHDSPASPCQFTLGPARFSFSSSHHRPAQFLELAPGPDLSACEYPIPGSHCTYQFPASQDIGLLCISNRNSEQRISTKGDLSTLTSIEKTNSSKVDQRYWSSHEVVNWPNAISFGRLVSGPLLGWLIMKGFLQPALIGLIIAGISDWLDGYIARRQGIHSAFGTYLDPLADKVLIGCVAFTMAQGGYLPWALVAVVIGRDAALIGGSLLMLGVQNLKSQALDDTFKVAKGSAQRINPLYISKVNTVFQLALVAVALLQPAFGIEDSYALVPILSWCVALTTCASFMGYGWKLLQQRL